MTIEHDGAVPLEFRRAIGNRVYGCDDCQLVCPWNKFAQRTALPDFAQRHGLGGISLLELWSWSEGEFEKRHEGSAIRRIGYSRWRRNIAIALGNALADTHLIDEDKQVIRTALVEALPLADQLVAEHIQWALSPLS